MSSERPASTPGRRAPSLRRILVRDLLLWFGGFVAALGLIFAATQNLLLQASIEQLAGQRLEHVGVALERGGELSGAEMLLVEPEIAALAVVPDDGSTRILTRGNREKIGRIVSGEAPPGPYHRFARKLTTGGSFVLLVDERPVRHRILRITLWALFLLTLLLALSIFALHRTLKRQLIVPLTRLTEAIDSGDGGTPPAQLERELPAEAGAILRTYGRLQRAYADREHRLSQIVAELPGTVWSASTDLRYTYVLAGAEPTFGRPPGELVSAPLWSWLTDEPLREQNLAALRQAMEQRREALTLTYTERGERGRSFEERIGIEYDDAGSPVLVHGFANDATERQRGRQQLEEKMQQIQRLEAVGTLAGGIAHEFNNTLTGIVGNLHLLREEVADHPEASERVDRIEAASRRAVEIIGQLLAFARPGGLHYRQTEVATFLERWHTLVGPMLPAPIDFRLEIVDNVLIGGDIDQLRQALVHILNNAVDALEGTSAPRITLDARLVEADDALARRNPLLLSRRLCRITLRDNGPGMPAELIRKAFDPFFSTKDVGKGTGLGLAMVYGCARGFGGTVEIESEPGAGTAVHLYLPVLAPTREEDLPAGEGETLLLLSGERAFRDGVRHLLETLHYRVVPAADPERAETALHGRPDIALAVVDLSRLQIDATEILRRFGQSRPMLPILLVAPHDADEALPAAGVRQLRLPLDPGELTRELRRMAKG